MGVFSLTGWSPQIHAEFLVFRATQVPSLLLNAVSPTGLSPAAAALSRAFGYSFKQNFLTVLLPRSVHCYTAGLGSYAFARHYLRNHCCFLFLRVLRCFSSPGSLRPSGRYPCGWVAPFGNPRVWRVFAPCRGLSQLVTSFFASKSQRHPSCALLSFLFFFFS